MKLLFSFLLILSCSQQSFFRNPASEGILKTKSLELGIVSGPEVASETIIAKSLSNADLKLEITYQDNEVSCKKDSDASYSQGATYNLASNSQGKFESVTCKRTHSGGPIPESSKISVKYILDKRTIDMSGDNLKLFKNFETHLDNLKKENFTSELTEFAEKNSQDLKLEIASNSRELVSSLACTGSCFLFFETATGEASYKVGMFKKYKNISKEGVVISDSKKKALINPNLNALELFCNGASGLNYKGSKPESYTIVDYKGTFSCGINLFKSGKITKNIGSFETVYKLINHSDLKKILESLIDDEEKKYDYVKESAYKKDENDFNSVVNYVVNFASSQERTLISLTEKYNRKQFEQKRDKIIGDLFPEEVTGKFAKAGNIFTFEAVPRKFIYKGNVQKIMTYLHLTNKAHVKFSSSDINHAFEYEPYTEAIKLYFYVDKEFDSKYKGFSLNICEGDKSSFFSKIAYLQRQANAKELPLATYTNTFKSIDVDNLSSCKISGGESSKYYRLSDSYFQYLMFNDKHIDDGYDYFTLKQVGAEYKGTFKELSLETKLLRDDSFSHPGFGADHKFKKDSKSKDQVIELEVSPDKFITMD